MLNSTTKTFYVFIASVLIFTFLAILTTESVSKESGAIVVAGKGSTGSPWDMQTCARSNCHAGDASSLDDVFSLDDIPDEGYTGGERYTLKVSLASSGKTVYGFQASPHDDTGNLLGTLHATDMTETQIVGNGSYITHTVNGLSDGVETKIWSFDWTAPPSGTGDVTLYGGFVMGNGDGSANGDLIATSDIVITENPLSAIGGESSISDWTLDFFTNPVSDALDIAVNVVKSCELAMSLVDISGKVVRDNGMLQMQPGLHKIQMDVLDIPSGIFLLRVHAGNAVAVKRVVKL